MTAIGRNLKLLYSNFVEIKILDAFLGISVPCLKKKKRKGVLNGKKKMKPNFERDFFIHIQWYHCIFILI